MKKEKMPLKEKIKFVFFLLLVTFPVWFLALLLLKSIATQAAR